MYALSLNQTNGLLVLSHQEHVQGHDDNKTQIHPRRAYKLWPGTTGVDLLVSYSKNSQTTHLSNVLG